MNEARELADFCNKHLDLANASLVDAYYYQSLPLCIIDAVFSINTRYKAVQNVIDRYCKFFNLRRVRSSKDRLPPLSDQEPVNNFLDKFKHYGIEKFTEKIFNNRQRTSSTGGILKTEAVLHFATVLNKHEVDYFQDVETILADTAFERDIKNIKGQGSGISLSYFFMLAGSDDLVKPDRHILTFLTNALSREVKVQEARSLIASSTEILRSSYPHLTPRLLDYVIWNYQRSHS